MPHRSSPSEGPGLESVAKSTDDTGVKSNEHINEHRHVSNMSRILCSGVGWGTRHGLTARASAHPQVIIAIYRFLSVGIRAQRRAVPDFVVDEGK